MNGGELIKYIPAPSKIGSKKNQEDKKMLDVIVILEEKYTEEELKKAKGINKDKIYTIELILQSIVEQELDLDSNKV